MTLIVAGYHGNEVFFIADSAITNNNKTLLSGFKKIHAIPINIHRPYFVKEFKRYYPYTDYKGEAVVALAGSTLIAQHVIDTIDAHLGKIRVTYKYDDKIKYYLIRHCDTKNNRLYSEKNCVFDDSFFLDNDIYQAINVEEIKKIIEYSIREALRSASKHVLGEEDWGRIINNEYLFSLSCPHTRENFLYKVTLKEESIEDTIRAIPVVEIIPKGSLGIIGLKNFNDELVEKYNSLLDGKSNIALEMLNFFENIIDRCNSSGNRGVAKPIIYKRYNGTLVKALSILRNGDWCQLNEDEVPFIISDKASAVS